MIVCKKLLKIFGKSKLFLKKEQKINLVYLIFINNINKCIKLFLINLIFIIISLKIKSKEIKIALCTIGKKENLYVKEFVEYYIKLGIDKIFIYDDNDINTEKIKDVINKLYKKYVKIYENIKNKIKMQFDSYNDCYNNHKYKFDWFLMIDMDEYLVIKKKSLKKYLSNSKFNKCDFIKFHWIIPNDNNLVHYDNRTLFERFKGPYIKFSFIKSIIRGNINNLTYSIHSPSISPERNISCNNIGKIIKSEKIYYESVFPININQAYIIHYKFKSTEEYINQLLSQYLLIFKMD